MDMNLDEPLRRVAPQRGPGGGGGEGRPLPDQDVLDLHFAIARLVAGEADRESREVAREAREVAREAREVAREARMEATRRNTTARFYNQTVVKLVDQVVPLYSQISDSMADLQINALIPDFPATVGDLAAVDPATSRLILRALEWSNDGLDDVGLMITLQKAIGVRCAFEG